LLITSCKSIKQSEIRFDDDFLSSHEWMIDSIYGSNKFTQDWIYFTPKKRFYRFSKFNKSYVIDSSLVWQRNHILKGDNILYKISKIDSQYIELKTEKEIFRAKRWNKFDSEDIERFISNNRYKLLINGKWKLDSTEIGIGGLPSNCDEIQAGAIMEFGENGRLQVFKKDSLNFCDRYSYQVYQDGLSLRKSDMIMDFPIIEISNNKLILMSKYIPKSNYTEETWLAGKKGFKLNLTKIEE